MRSELCIEKAKRPLHRRSGLYHLILAGLLPELIEAFIILKAGCPHLAHDLPDICIVIFTELFKRRVSVSKHHIQKTEKYIRIFRQTIIHITLFSSSGPDPVLSGGPFPARKTPDAGITVLPPNQIIANYYDLLRIITIYCSLLRFIADLTDISLLRPAFI